MTCHIVQRYQMAGQSLVEDLILWVQNQEDQIETRQKCVGQLNIIDDVLALVPLRLGRIGSCQNGCACIQLTNDACFGNTQGLLLHYLVQDTASRIIHLIELIDTTDTVVGQHKGAPGNRVNVCKPGGSMKMTQLTFAAPADASPDPW